MDIPLLIDSSKLPNQDSDNFEVFFQNPIELDGIPHEIALKQLATWYTWFNIHDTEYDNHRFRYYNNDTWQTINIPNGNYTVDQLQDAIHVGMKENGDVNVDSITGEETFNINLIPNYSTIKLFIEVKDSFEVDLTVGNLYLLLGFTSIVVDSSQYGANNVNITNSVNTISLHCSIVSGNSYDNDQASDILYTFVPAVPPGASIVICPHEPTYIGVTKAGNIDRIRIRLTDQLGRRINLNGENLTVSLHLRPKKKFYKEFQI